MDKITENIIQKYSGEMAQLRYDKYLLESQYEVLLKENENIKEQLEKLKDDEFIGEQVVNLLEAKEEVDGHTKDN